MTVRIMLSGKAGAGLFALVDDEDAERIGAHRWNLLSVKKLQYAKTSMSGRSTLMHRLVTAAPDHLHVDHINGNGLDNRRANLRLCTHAENVRYGVERRGPLPLEARRPVIVRAKGRFYVYAYRGGPRILTAETRPSAEQLHNALQNAGA